MVIPVANVPNVSPSSGQFPSPHDVPPDWTFTVLFGFTMSTLFIFVFISPWSHKYSPFNQLLLPSHTTLIQSTTTSIPRMIQGGIIAACVIATVLLLIAIMIYANIPPHRKRRPKTGSDSSSSAATSSSRKTLPGPPPPPPIAMPMPAMMVDQMA